MKYNKSEIMKNAWAMFRNCKTCVNPLSFGECLSRAWASAKRTESYKHGTHSVNLGTLMHEKIVVVDMDNLIVSGNTFPVKETLKRKYECKWDKENKVWTGDFENLFNLVAHNFAA